MDSLIFFCIKSHFFSLLLVSVVGFVLSAALLLLFCSFITEVLFPMEEGCTVLEVSVVAVFFGGVLEVAFTTVVDACVVVWSEDGDELEILSPSLLDEVVLASIISGSGSGSGSYLSIVRFSKSCPNFVIMILTINKSKNKTVNWNWLSKKCL